MPDKHRVLILGGGFAGLHARGHDGGTLSSQFRQQRGDLFGGFGFVGHGGVILFRKLTGGDDISYAENAPMRQFPHMKPSDQSLISLARNQASA